ncbi:MAG: helix-turn-helix transcriptional regulator [Sphingobacteriaceae bacterium]|jgi:DNA-binding CsgD family transcriptional regulator|nr:helix-turn-helix transcriptional regulator [Sphingobacteriaceae bacterium]
MESLAPPRDLELLMQEKINKVAGVSGELPGVVIVHTVHDFKVQYMSEAGLKPLGISLEEVKELSSEEYHSRFFNPHDAARYLPKIKEMLSKNTDEAISFFQQVRTATDGNWIWHLSTMKVLLRNEEGIPVLTVTMAFPVDPLQHITSKVSRLLDENDFLRKHYNQFSKLGKREQEVLKFMALGLSSIEIAEKLHISAATADTHRRNIRQKLNVNSSYEVAEYARAFDLI